MKIQECKFVEVSELVSEDWSHWFWTALCDSDPDFTWGSNNRSMVTADYFADVCQDVLETCDENVPEKEKEEFLKSIRDLGQMYIDLEN